MELVQRLLAGDRRAAARLITQIERGGERVREVISDIHKHTGRAMVIGITGPPGTGKSTLVSALTLAFRKQGKSVGILAVDPTSPFTGGALLGDRIRMQDVAMDRGVFIRSMGTRGNLGGLSWATSDAVKVLDAMGKDVIIVETVGAGQAEVDIVETAHTSIVIVMPGLGDDIQTIKAGLMEIGNIFVVNKADLAGADKRKMEVEAMLHLGEHEGWTPPVHLTVARECQGIRELMGSIEAHWDHLRANGLLEGMERKRLKAEILEILDHGLHDLVRSKVDPGQMEAMLDRVTARETSPYDAAQAILDQVLGKD